MDNSGSTDTLSQVTPARGDASPGSKGGMSIGQGTVGKTDSKGGGSPKSKYGTVNPPPYKGGENSADSDKVGAPKRKGRPRKTSPKRKMNLVGAGARVGRAGIAAGV